MHRGIGIFIFTLCLAAVAHAETYEAPAIIRAEDETKLSAQISAQINEMPFRVGEHFEQGDALVTFDCTRFQANLAEATATAKAAEARHMVNARLASYQAIGRGEVMVSRAEAEAALARVKSLSEIVSDCVILAPYAGRVVSTEASHFATPEVGAPLMTVLNEEGLIIEMIAPSLWLRWLELGQVLTLEVRETGQSLSAVVDRIGPVVDPVSQTVDVFARFGNVPEKVLSGMSGRAVLTGPALND